MEEAEVFYLRDSDEENMDIDEEEMAEHDGESDQPSVYVPQRSRTTMTPQDMNAPEVQPQAHKPVKQR